MDSSHIDLKGSRIQSIASVPPMVRIVFSRALIIKSMTGSQERTRWWQPGALVLLGVQNHTALPEGPLVCAGGDIDENVYTYRDMLPIPFKSRGHIRCVLRFDGPTASFTVEATSANLELEEAPTYLEHLR